MNSNGVLSFDQFFTEFSPQQFPINSPHLIAPFWHDFNPRVAGRIFYRQTSNTDQLNTVHQLFTILDTGELRDFSPTHLFVATWDQVSQFGGSSEVSTMSCMYDCKRILATSRYN